MTNKQKYYFNRRYNNPTHTDDLNRPLESFLVAAAVLIVLAFFINCSSTTTQDVNSGGRPIDTSEAVNVPGGGLPSTTPGAGSRNYSIEDIQELVSRPVYFEFDKSFLTADARQLLANYAATLSSDNAPGVIITIHGHADSIGESTYNIALSERRAETAKTYLNTLGIPSTRIRTIAHGEEQLTCNQNTESCHALNRRDVLRVRR